MIRQAAFTGTSKLLKGGLHCHTTRSDGGGTPEEVIAKHVRHGYDFLALTDHRIYNYENFAPDQKITIIPGMEIDGNIQGDQGVHCFHTVCIGPSRADGNGFEQNQRFEGRMVKDQYEYQPTLDEMHQNKNMTIYCHPDWSGTPAWEFAEMCGNFAMEIWNSGCAVEDEMDTDNGAWWDELLMRGQKIFAVASDDGHAMSQHCLGWVRVNAQNNIDDILAALKEGAFYASTGPEIYDFFVDDEGTAHVSCSKCAHIDFLYGRYPTRVYRGEGITEAAMKVPDFFRYVRARVVDETGKRAWSNPIFLK